MFCQVCGLTYSALRTGETFASVRRMMFVATDDTTQWVYKRRRCVLRFWRKLKEMLWDEHRGLCEQWEREERVAATKAKKSMKRPSKTSPKSSPSVSSARRARGSPATRKGKVARGSLANTTGRASTSEMRSSSPPSLPQSPQSSTGLATPINVPAPGPSGWTLPNVPAPGPSEWTVPGETGRIRWNFDSLAVDEERTLPEGVTFKKARWGVRNYMERHPGVKIALREVDGLLQAKRLA
jgi:hypothetical protein